MVILSADYVYNIGSIIGLVILIIASCCVFGFIAGSVLDGSLKAGIFSALILCVLLLLLFIPKCVVNYNTLEVQAIINDDTKFKEIYNNWKVEDVDGRIYTLRKLVDRKNFDIDTFVEENINE